MNDLMRNLLSLDKIDDSQKEIYLKQIKCISITENKSENLIMLVNWFTKKYLTDFAHDLYQYAFEVYGEKYEDPTYEIERSVKYLYELEMDISLDSPNNAYSKEEIFIRHLAIMLHIINDCIQYNLFSSYNEIASIYLGFEYLRLNNINLYYTRADLMYMITTLKNKDCKFNDKVDVITNLLINKNIDCL